MEKYKNRFIVGTFKTGEREKISKEIDHLLASGYSKGDIIIHGNSTTIEAFGITKGVHVERKTQNDYERTDQSYWERTKDAFTVVEHNFDDESSIIKPFKAMLEPYLKILEDGAILLTVDRDLFSDREDNGTP